jgi:hypothetical protein
MTPKSEDMAETKKLTVTKFMDFSRINQIPCRMDLTTIMGQSVAAKLLVDLTKSKTGEYLAAPGAQAHSKGRAGTDGALASVRLRMCTYK